MRYALTRQGVRTAEENAITRLGVTMAELMERAGRAVAAEVERLVADGSVAVVAGKGNNGGDGWAAARVLHIAGREVTVFSPMEPDRIEGIAGDAARRARDDDVRYVVLDGDLDVALLASRAVLVDALFGVGFCGDTVREPYGSWIRAINDSRVPVVAVDIASGVDADTGKASTPAVRADVTVSLVAPKIGSLVYPGAALSGDVVTHDIGVAAEPSGSVGDLELWGREEYATLLPAHGFDVHKNTRGRVLVVAGSGAYPGAAMLTAMGAQRAGAGYVSVAVPESIAPIVQARLASVVVVGLAENPSRTLASRVTDEILDVAREFDAVVVGPGMTVAHGAVLAVRKLVTGLTASLVLDADGLNAMVDAVDLLQSRTAPTVITPHPGELARLLGATPAAIQADRLSYGARLSGPRMACVLKGARTVTSGAARQILNLPGGPGLATAGTGDVLAGVIGTLLAQGLEPLDAGALGAYLHGTAGDLAAEEFTQRCVIAEDIPRFLPQAVAGLLGG